MNRLILLIMLSVLTSLQAVGKEVMRYHRYTVADGLLQNNATTFAQDKDGCIWIGSRSGLCRFDGAHFVPFRYTSDGKKIGWIRKLRIDKDGHTLLMKVNNERYVSFNPSTLVIKPLPQLKLGDQNPPKSVLAYGDEGLVLHHGGVEYDIPYQGTPVSQFLHCENFVDRQGNVWAGFDNAVFQITFSNADYAIYKKVGDAAGTDFTADVRCLARLKDGTCLVGTKAKQVIRYSAAGQFMGYLNAQGKVQMAPTEFVESPYNIQQDAQGRIWLALRVGGLVCIDKPFTSGQKLYWYRKQNTPRLPMDQVFDIHLSARTGWLWIGTWGGGVVVVDTKNPRLRLDQLSAAIHDVDRSELAKVRRICELGDTIALCTTEGLYMYTQQGKLISHIGDVDVSGVIRMDGTLYVGAYSQGAFIVDEHGQLQQLDIPGLGDCIHSVVACPNHQVLFSNPDGLVLYDTQRGSSRYFDTTYFGENVSFSEIQPLIDKDMLYTGLKDGILQMQLSPFHTNYLPAIYIENAGATISMGGEIVVRPSVMDYRIPRTVSYAWREKGDSTWHYLVGGNEEVTLSWLMPGRHVVEFCSTDAMGLWTDNVTEATFYVVPSWWQWCIIAMVLVIMGVIGWLIWKVNHPRLITSSDTTVDTTTDLFPSAPDATPYDRELAQKLVDCIERKMADPDYGVEQLAADMGMSRTQLYTHCKDTLDKTPAAFILEIRIKRAMQLIETHQLRINEITYRVGFTDPKYFAKVFKKRVGVTPTQYANT